jgi:hypothetical protein
MVLGKDVLDVLKAPNMHAEVARSPKSSENVEPDSW